MSVLMPRRLHRGCSADEAPERVRRVSALRFAWRTLIQARDEVLRVIGVYAVIHRHPRERLVAHCAVLGRLEAPAR